LISISIRSADGNTGDQVTEAIYRV